MIEIKDRPKCKTCGWRLADIHFVHGKDYYRTECSHCSRVRRGKPLYNGLSCSHTKRVAIRLGLNGYKCVNCGWVGYCETHHRNGHPSDNGKDNLEILCPNCHMDAHHGKPNLD